MYIVGAGVAYPSHQISNLDLKTLGLEAAITQVTQRSGVQSRGTCIASEFLLQNKNQDLVATSKSVTEHATTLGARAVEAALKVAALTPDSIGLVVADSITPIETTPSEAQRIAGMLGMKIPAFDMVSGTGSIPAHIDILSRWKSERIPENIVSISTNVPTLRINYSSDAESAALFGDGASAIVLSRSSRAGLKVLASAFWYDAQAVSPIGLDTLGYFTSTPRSIEVQRRQALDIFVELTKKGLMTPSTLVLWAASNNHMRTEVTHAQGISADNVRGILSERGDLLSANLGALLAENWSDIQVGQRVLCVLAAGESQYGYLMLERE